MRPSASVHRFPIEGGLLLLDRRSNCLFAYNGTARHVWDLVEAGRDAEHAATEFTRVWGISRSRARADIDAILAQWRMQALLIEDEPSRPPNASNSDIATEARWPEPAQWAAEWTCTIRGVTIGFGAETELVGSIRTLLRHLETPGMTPQARIEIRNAALGAFVVLRDGEERIRTIDPAQLVGGLWQTILETIHPDLSWLAVIHGAALARNGTGLALAAPSGSGKSTLAAGLLGKGFDFLADDMVGLSEPDGVVVPWPLPLSIKPGSIDVLTPLWPELAEAPVYWTKGVDARLLVPPAAVWDTPPVEIRHLIFPRYQRGAPPELKPLGTFQALERLLADRIWLGCPMTETRVTNFLSWLTRISAHTLSYGSLQDAARLIEDLVA